MRAPARRREFRRATSSPPEGCDLTELGKAVRYVGSAEHKSYPSFAGSPKLRADATKCDPGLTDAASITSWLRNGIRSGRVGAPWEGRFPRYVWHEVDGVLFEARLVNREAGEYKGYPLDPSERPDGL